MILPRMCAPDLRLAFLIMIRSGWLDLGQTQPHGRVLDVPESEGRRS